MTQPTQDQGRTVAAAAAQGRPFPAPQGSGSAGPRPANSRPEAPGYGQQPGYPPPPSGYGPRDRPGGAGGGDGEQDTAGWLVPSPEALAHYERIQSGMAERIIALAEQEARFRWDPGADDAAGGSTDRIAQLLALVIIVLFFAAGVYLIGSGKQVAGCILGVVDLIALISVFATAGRRGKR